MYTYPNYQLTHKLKTHENVNIKIGSYVSKSRKTVQIPYSRGAEMRFRRIILFPDSMNYSAKLQRDQWL